MSGVIKSGAAAAAVHPFPLTSTVLQPQSSPEEEDHQRLLCKVDGLEKELSSRETSLTKLRRDVEEAYVRGKAEGHSAGLAAAGKQDAERIKLLEQALGSAKTDLRQSLSSLDRLAALLARDSLAMILENPDYRHDLLEQIIATQIAKVEKSLVIEILLSPEDFPDTEVLSTVANKVGISPTALIATGEIPPGGCVMKMRLGHQEIGITQQWNVLRAHLEELSLPEEPA